MTKSNAPTATDLPACSSASVVNTPSMPIEALLDSMVESDAMQSILSMLKQEGLAKPSLSMKVQDKTVKVH